MHPLNYILCQTQSGARKPPTASKTFEWKILFQTHPPPKRGAKHLHGKFGFGASWAHAVPRWNTWATKGKKQTTLSNGCVLCFCSTGLHSTRQYAWSTNRTRKQRTRPGPRGPGYSMGGARPPCTPPKSGRRGRPNAPPEKICNTSAKLHTLHLLPTATSKKCKITSGGAIGKQDSVIKKKQSKCFCFEPYTPEGTNTHIRRNI